MDETDFPSKGIFCQSCFAVLNTVQKRTFWQAIVGPAAVPFEQFCRGNPPRVSVHPPTPEAQRNQTFGFWHQRLPALQPLYSASADVGGLRCFWSISSPNTLCFDMTLGLTLNNRHFHPTVSISVEPNAVQGFHTH